MLFVTICFDHRRRLEGLGRSPIFEMMGEALAGISTIRTNSSLQYFQRKFESIHDAHTRAFFAFVSSSRWFATRLEFVTFLLMTIATFFSALLYDKGKRLTIVVACFELLAAL
jgi:ATP-binding cassette subfamily C (CFTR/MRP) protein 4